MRPTRRSTGEVAAQELRLRLGRATEISGVESTAKRIGISPTTLLRVLAAQPVFKGTILIVERALESARR